MATPRDVTSRIKGFFASPQSYRPTDLAELSVTYAEYCNLVNERLHRCDDYLQRGLLSEAIHYAELKPDVLDLVSDLEFLESDDWRDYCQQQKLEIAPRLLNDVARNLNAAYDIYRPMADLLKAHRTSALIRAPLSLRLRILQKLAKADPENTIWEEDCEAYEKARLKEIKTEAKVATKANDLETLQALLEEMTKTRWHVSVPESQVKAIRKLLRQVEVGHLLADLTAMLQELDDAYIAMSFEECSVLVDEWSQKVDSNDLTVPVEMQTRVQPIIDWVMAQREERFAHEEFVQACGQLERGLDGKLSTPDLRRLYLAANAFDQPIPEDLDRRYKAELAARDLSARRKGRVLVALALSVLITVGVGLFAFMQSRHHKRESHQLSVQIEEAIGQGELDRGMTLWNTLAQGKPSLAQRTELVGVKTRLDDAIAQRKNQTREFRFLVGQIEPSNLEEHDRESMSKMRKALAHAEELASTSDQRIEVITLRAQLDRIAEKWQKEIDDAYIARIGILERNIDNMPVSFMKEDPDGYHRQLTELSKEMKGIESEFQSASARVRTLLLPQQKRLKGMEKAFKAVQAMNNRSRRIADALDALVGTVDSAEAFGKGLNDFAKKFPDDARSAAFRESAKQEPAWLAVQNWDRLLHSLGPNPLSVRNSEIDERLKAIDDYVDIQPLEEYVRYLKRTAAAMLPISAWPEDQINFLNVFRGLGELLYIKTTDGKIFYTPPNPQITSDSIGLRVEIILSPDSGKAELKYIKNPEFKKPRECPHKTLVEDILKRIKKVSVSNIDVLGLDVAQIVLDRVDVEPVLRAYMLSFALLQLHVQFGGALPEEVEPILEQLLPQNWDSINWVDPNNVEANEVRSKLRTAMDGNQWLSDLRKKTLERRQALIEALRTDRVGYGFLIRDNEKWTVKAAPIVLTEGRTAQVVSESKPGTLVLRQIGTVVDGAMKIVPAALEAVPEGTLVFINEKSSE